MDQEINDDCKCILYDGSMSNGLWNHSFFTVG